MISHESFVLVGYPFAPFLPYFLQLFPLKRYLALLEILIQWKLNLISNNYFYCKYRADFG